MQIFLAKLVGLAGYALEMLIIVRVMTSWFSPNQFNPLIVQLYKITDPLLRPFQNIIPSYKLGIDISPLFALAALRVIENLLLKIIFAF